MRTRLTAVCFSVTLVALADVALCLNMASASTRTLPAEQGSNLKESIVKEDHVTLFSKQEFAMARVLGETAMTEFVKLLLEREGKYVAVDNETSLKAFVHAFTSGNATGSFEQMREQLATQSWVMTVSSARKLRDIVSSTKITGKAEETAGFSAIAIKSQPVAGIMNAYALNKSNLSAIKLASEAHQNLVTDKRSKCAECIAWGGSHVLSFNTFRKHLATHPRREAFHRTTGWTQDQQSPSEGTYWMVRTPDVHIQADYLKNTTRNLSSVLRSLAVSGPFLGGNVLGISSLSHRVTWNGQEILREIPSTFQNGFLSARYISQSEIVSTGKTGNGVEFKFSNGLFLVVNRWRRSLTARVHMCPSQAGAGGLEGQCGTLDDTPFVIAQALLSVPGANKIGKGERINITEVRAL